MKIKCPKCGIEGALSLVQPRYRGPYRCWNCKELFTILVENNELKSCEPLSLDEFKKQQEQEMAASKDKLRRNYQE